MSKTIAVLGAGTMGNGIAHVFAMHGYTVHLADLSARQLQKAMSVISHNLDRMVRKERITSDDKVRALVNIHTFEKVAPAVEHAYLVIEAITENEQLKTNIFKDLNQMAPERAILASNTSSISITRLAREVTFPERVIGMHFMNPVPVMKLVEVIRGYQTSDEVADQVLDLCADIEKIAVEVNDYPGFISNRILMPMINEAIYALFEGVSTVDAIDDIMKLGMAHPMGPLELADFIGLDVCLSILDVLYEGFGNPKYAPCPLLVNMVTAGKNGRKSGEGFYTYPPDEEPYVSIQFNRPG